MVFALGSLYDLDQAPCTSVGLLLRTPLLLITLSNRSVNPQAARFHAIARACMAQKPTASIFAIQTISLMGSYLLNGPDATKGGQTLWPFFGLALKWAQSVRHSAFHLDGWMEDSHFLTQIGLHRDGSQWGLEPSEVEERRRVFWEASRSRSMDSISRLVLTRSVASVDLRIRYYSSFQSRSTTR